MKNKFVAFMWGIPVGMWIGMLLMALAYLL
jgi:hypothetical protein